MDLADIHCYDDNSSYSLFFSSAKMKKWLSVESESQGLEEPVGDVLTHIHILIER